MRVPLPAAQGRRGASPRGDLTIICVRKRPNEPMRTISIPADIAARFRPARESGVNP